MRALPAPASGQVDLIAPALRRRLACLVYEALILLGIALTTAAVVVFVLHGLGADRSAGAGRTAMQATEFAVLTLYGTWFWSAGRQTLPMKTWRIRIVTSNGEPLGLGRALLRALLCWLWVLPALILSAVLHLSTQETGLLLGVWVLLWALAGRLRRDRQFLHDALARTRLIHGRT
ncbi:MAG: RDD family protein [Thiomonas sp.]